MSKLHSGTSEIAIFKFGKNTDNCSPFAKMSLCQTINNSAAHCPMTLKVETMIDTYTTLVIKAGNDWLLGDLQAATHSSFSTSINKNTCKKQNNVVVIQCVPKK